MTPARPNTMRSVRRCFELMELFDETRQALSASDISRKIDAPLSSIMDLLKCLQDLGYIAYDSRDRTYFMTTRLAVLGHWMAESKISEKSYLAIIEELHEKTRETVCVFWQDNLAMKCVASKRGSHPLSFNMSVGDTVPTLGTAVGTALLAQWEDSDIFKLIKKASHHGESSIDEKKILRAINKTRKDGYCCTYDEYMSEVGAIALAVPVMINQWLVFSVGGSSKRIKKEESNIVQLLRSIALEATIK